MKFYIVDCFAEEKYQGNELLVVKTDRPVSDEEQQKERVRKGWFPAGPGHKGQD